MTRDFQKLWLKVTAITVGGFAPLFFLATMEATSAPARLMMDLIDFPLDGSIIWDGKSTRFLSALTAGFLLGWGVLIWCLQAWVFDAAPEGVRKSVLASGLAWFVLDSIGSVTSGAAPNVIPNIALLAFICGPLLRPAQEPLGATT